LALLHWFGAATCRLSRRETLLPCSVGVVRLWGLGSVRRVKKQSKTLQRCNSMEPVVSLCCGGCFAGGRKHLAAKHSLCDWGSYMLCVADVLLTLKCGKALMISSEAYNVTLCYCKMNLLRVAF